MKIKCVSITLIILILLHFIFLKKTHEALFNTRDISTLIFDWTFDSTQSLEEILTDFNELISFANSIFRPLKVSGPHLESTFLDFQEISHEILLQLREHQAVSKRQVTEKEQLLKNQNKLQSYFLIFML